MSNYKNYVKKGVQAMRPYIQGEDLTGVSVSEKDTPEAGGMIAKGSDDGALWYVSKGFYEKNYTLASSDLKKCKYTEEKCMYVDSGE